MTAAGAPGPGTKARYGDLTRRVRRRLVAFCLLRAALSATVLVLVYYKLPLDNNGDIRLGTGLAVGLLVFVAVVAAQLWQITKSRYPVLRAVEALATAVPMFLLLFAASYYVMGQEQAGSFSETLDRTDSLYFTTTVFSTVGFGDITPRSEPARVLTMVQMIANLLIFGIAARLLVNAVSAGRLARSGTATAPAVTPPAPAPDGTIHTG